MIQMMNTRACIDLIHQLNYPPQQLVVSHQQLVSQSASSPRGAWRMQAAQEPGKPGALRGRETANPWV